MRTNPSNHPKAKDINSAAVLQKCKCGKIEKIIGSWKLIPPQNNRKSDQTKCFCSGIPESPFPCDPCPLENTGPPDQC